MAAPPELQLFRAALRDGGVRGALAWLNSRTPHRFTAIYRYDGDMMRNVVLFDRSEPESERGIDVAVADAYCGVVAKSGRPFQFADAHLDPRVRHLPGNPIVCYCGVVIRAADGEAYGTLCHYDFQRSQMRTSDIPLLEAAAPLVYAALVSDASRRTA